MANATRSTVAMNIWTARVIPVILAGLVGYATYIVVGPLTIDYLLTKRQDTTAAIPILITYFLLLIFWAASFFRLVYITFLEPPYVPLGPAAIRDRARSREKEDLRDGIGSGEYNSGDGALDSDSPGLESFYTRDIFVTEMDGKPKWCTHCGNWKPDRAHHCSSSGRCIKKMDHFCPWVGGPIGENNFKFFVQFTGYTTLYCIHVIVVMAIYVHQQRTTPDESLNAQFIVALVISGFFGLFTAGMTATSIELAIRNQTQVERLGAETRLHILAMIKPSIINLTPVNGSAGPVLSYPEITYPLGAGIPPSNDHQALNGTPQSKTNSHTRQVDHVLVQKTNQAGPGDVATITSKDRSEPRPLSSSIAVDRSTQESLPSSRDLSDRSTVAASGSADGPLQGHQWPSKEIAERDLRATRTFMILKMPETGYNPWDLGSSLLNWESVMGTTVIDWFLPLRRSPCCNHDDSESYYSVGPMVDLLRSKYNLIPEADIRAYGGRRRTERRDPAEIHESNSRPSDSDRREAHRKTRRRRHHSDKVEGSAAAEEPTEMTDFNERK